MSLEICFSKFTPAFPGPGVSPTPKKALERLQILASSREFIFSFSSAKPERGNQGVWRSVVSGCVLANPGRAVGSKLRRLAWCPFFCRPLPGCEFFFFFFFFFFKMWTLLCCCVDIDSFRELCCPSSAQTVPKLCLGIFLCLWPGDAIG